MPEPFKFSGDGCQDFEIEVKNMVAVISDKSISTNIQDPDNQSVWFLAELKGTSTRFVKMPGWKEKEMRWPRTEPWERSVVTDGIHFYNVVTANFYERKRKLKNRLMISRHRTHANKMGCKEQRKVKTAIRDYLAS